jgi:NAD(P)-dependent dehydrogenase (short-subunit alcohol dehydrogenase family)
MATAAAAASEELLRFDGRVAIVSGAGSGLGRAYALDLARRGCAVVVNDYGGVSSGRYAGETGTIDKAQAVVDEIIAAGGSAVANGASVADYDAVAAMVADTVARWGRVDIIIANAGVHRDRRIEKLEEEDYDVTFDVSVKGSFNMVRHAWPHMVAQGYGKILLTTSVSH